MFNASFELSCYECNSAEFWTLAYQHNIPLDTDFCYYKVASIAPELKCDAGHVQSGTGQIFSWAIIRQAENFYTTATPFIQLACSNNFNQMKETANHIVSSCYRSGCSNRQLLLPSSKVKTIYWKKGSTLQHHCQINKSTNLYCKPWNPLQFFALA